MINNIQKLTLAMFFAYVSDDMKVNIVSFPKFQNKNFCLVSAKDDSFNCVMPPVEKSEEVDKFFKTIIGYFYKVNKNDELSDNLSSEERRRFQVAEPDSSGLFRARNQDD